MKRITQNQAIYYANKLGVRFSKKKYTSKDFLIGMRIELEHGKENRRTNVTNDDLLMTAKITLAHLNERWDYYRRLIKYVEN
jgi:hypothetical protein